MSPWTVDVGALVLIIGFTCVVWSWSRAANNLIRLLGREDRLVELTAKAQALEDDRRQSKVTALQLQAVIRQIRPFLSEYHRIRESGSDNPIEVGKNLDGLLSRLVERLPLDIKLLSGEAHRSGLWVVDWHSRKLILAWASTGFPADYRYSRTLDIDHSIAGRAVRKGTTEIVDDVTKDPDYSPPRYAHDYRALICIPIAYRDDIGAVLTTDGKHPFSESQIDICHAYAGVMELVFGEYMDTIPTPIGKGGSST